MSEEMAGTGLSAESTPVKKREDVMIWQGLVVPVLLGLTLFFGFSQMVQPLIEAFLLAAGGVVAAFGVEWRAALPLLGGLVKAAFALVAGFGLNLPPNVQVGVLMVVSAVVAYYTQSQVTAKVSQSSYRLAA